MKIQFTFIFLLTSLIVFSQDMSQSLISTNGSNNSMGLIDLRGFESSATIEGSAYVNDKFLPARIEGVEGVHLLRYNAANDDIEYQKEDDKIFVLNKSDKKYDISFIGTKNALRVYDYTNTYGDSVKGFLNELYASKISLLKREKIKYVAEKYPKNGYDNLVPAHFERENDQYYIKDGERIVAFPKNKKYLIALYPSKKAELENFFKQNRYSFKDEKDLTAIASYLSAIL
jgi:hypothetical protein